MEEEIFGPVLPILEYINFDEIIEKINSRSKPLAFYHFTFSRKNERKALKKISFGGGCINDTIMHLASTTLPFGGVGDSGMGGYHGKMSFDTFSHYKGVLRKSNLFDMPLRYPPYGNHIKMLKRLIK